MAEKKASHCQDNQGLEAKLWAVVDGLRNKMATAIAANLKDFGYGG